MKVGWRKIVLFLLILAAIGVGGSIFYASRIMKQVQYPRRGRALGNAVALVFSARYDVSLASLEKLYHFDIHKYKNIYLQLVHDGLLRPQDVFVPTEATRDDLLLMHTEEYLARLRNPRYVAGYLEFYPIAFVPGGIIESAMLRAFRYCTGGTILASRLALEHGIGINLGGGYHHARPDKGGGFCIYADVPIAIRKLQKEGLIKRALLVDLDLHQGDGSAVCFEGDDDIFTFSIHEENIYPIPKGKSDLDVGLPSNVADAQYLKILRENLPKVIWKARPDIIYFFAGVDVYEGDRLGSMQLTAEGILERDMYVIEQATKRKIPIVMVLSGGYCPMSWRLQYNTIRRIIEKYALVKARDHVAPGKRLKGKK